MTNIFQYSNNYHNINHVIHFTNVMNLKSILANGLITRHELNNNSIEFHHNDNYRFDGFTNSVSCSIERPNYKMLYKLRMNNRDSEWVIIILNKSVLWEKNCAFFETNAASAKMREKPINQRQNQITFDSLFGELNWSHPRADLNIPDSYPTDPQAEILIFDTIESGYISHVILEDGRRINESIEKRYPSIRFQNHKPFFSPRRDYEHWKSNNNFVF